MAGVNGLGVLAIKAIVVFEMMIAIGMIIAFIFMDLLRSVDKSHLRS